MLPRTALLLRVVLENCHPSYQFMDSWHLCLITRLSYKYCATVTAATTTIVIAPMIVITIAVITIIIISAILKANFPNYLMFLRVLSVMSQQPPAVERYNTLHKM